MTFQSFRFDHLGTWVLIFGVSLAYVSMAQAADPAGASSDRRPECHPSSSPSRHCRPVRTGDPVLAPTSRAVEQTGPDEPYGILPHHVTIEQKIEKVRKDGKRSGLSPEVIEKIAQDMERGFREEEARPKPTLETGIFPGEAIRERLGTGRSAYYLVENGWFDIVSGKEVSVYAGSMRRDPENDAIQYDPLTVHGFVIIVKGQMGQPGTTVNRIYTSTAVGSLHVVSAKGTVLTLQSRQGNKFLLDIVTEQLTPLGNHEARPR